MLSKKAQVFKKIVGIVVVLAVVLVLVIIAIRSGTFFSRSFESVASCQADQPVGLGGECDCFFGGECPGGTDGVVHPDCPRTACSNLEDYEAKKDLAQQNFEGDVKRIEGETGSRLEGTMLRVVESKHFGQCCKGATPFEGSAGEEVKRPENPVKGEEE